MPTYDYRCSACGHAFEKFQKMSEGAVRKCPECGELKLKRLMGTGAGVIFKGSGFYETDYKRKSGGSSTGKSSSGDSSGSSGSSGSSSSEKKSTEGSDPSKKKKDD